MRKLSHRITPARLAYMRDLDAMGSGEPPTRGPVRNHLWRLKWVEGVYEVLETGERILMDAFQEMFPADEYPERYDRVRFAGVTLTQAGREAMSAEETHDAIIDAARDLVALWQSPRIKCLPRAERNAAIEETRNRLIEAVNVSSNFQRPARNEHGGPSGASGQSGGTQEQASCDASADQAPIEGEAPADQGSQRTETGTDAEVSFGGPRLLVGRC